MNHVAVITSAWLTLINPALAADATIDFLFSNDNQAIESKQFGGLQGKSALPNDKWFSEPLTRLDYILMNMQSHLNAAQFIKHTLEDLSKKSFENTKSDPSISYNVGYKEPKGRIVIAATIDANGKPKKPMREICETVLETLKMAYPISPFGYAWHNKALGILQRDDADLYNKVVLELIESAVYRQNSIQHINRAT